jgi:hypothetical protein
VIKFATVSVRKVRGMRVPQTSTHPPTHTQVKRVKGDYMKDPAFTLDNIKNISTAGAGQLGKPRIWPNANVQTSAGTETPRPVLLRRTMCPSRPAPTPVLTPGLLKWVLAMVNYFGVARGVEPKRKKVGNQVLVFERCCHDFVHTPVMS